MFNELRRIVLSLVVVLGVVLSACTIDQDEDQEDQQDQENQNVSSSLNPEPSTTELDIPVASTEPSELLTPTVAAGEEMPAVTGTEESTLRADVQSLVVAHGAIAVAGLGEANQLDFTVPAWSTIKVPISIAALRQNTNVSGDVALAIQQSDNDAAARLWNSLNSPAADTAAIISEGGSSALVQDQQVAPPYSPFGQSQWGIMEQANFAANLRCIDGSQEAVSYMGAISNGGNYGLGTIPGAIFKGGWGPNPSGMYGLRQFGLIPNSQGYVAVAIAATSPDGSYESGQQVLTHMAQNLYSVIEELPANAC